MEKHTIKAINAPQVSAWMQTRGGIAIWESIDLSNPGVTWTTPFYTVEGKPMEKPHWRVGNTPTRRILDPAEILVAEDREVKRFHVATRLGAQGMIVKCTDASSAKIHREVKKAGEGAYHLFDDGDFKNCIIMAPVKTIPLSEWCIENSKDKAA